MLSLPSDSVEWEASSCHSWNALRMARTAENDLKFRTAVRSCFDPVLQGQIQLTDQQHIHIIAVTFARYIWSIKELQWSPIIDLTQEYWPC
jgi:hypothetical protein